MSISLLDIWNFVINFNLLLFFIIFIIFYIYSTAIKYEGLLSGILVGSFVSFCLFVLSWVIFDVWLNWIEIESWFFSIIDALKEADI
jgi:hypothetical protein